MRIIFRSGDPTSILATIKSLLAEHDISDLVSFSGDESHLIVTISKLGTSNLIFKISRNDDGSEVLYELVKEKVAFAHRAVKDRVTRHIKELLVQAGGEFV